MVYLINISKDNYLAVIIIRQDIYTGVTPEQYFTGFSRKDGKKKLLV